jgi:glutathione S-transferase
MSDRPLTLFGERKLDSPFVFTAFVALAEKRVPFELRLLDLSAGEQRAASFKAISLTGRVPTLEAKGFSVSESLAIVEYLEETLPPPGHPALLPVHPEGRARIRQVLGWLRTDLAGLRRARPSESIFFEHVTTPLDDAARKDAEKLVTIASELVAMRGTIGAEWSIADADLAFALQRLIANGDELPETVRRYALAQWARPSVAAWTALERPARGAVITAP